MLVKAESVYDCLTAHKVPPFVTLATVKDITLSGWTFNLMRDWDKGIADNSKAIELNPKFADPYIGRSIAYLNKVGSALLGMFAAIGFLWPFLNTVK